MNQRFFDSAQQPVASSASDPRPYLPSKPKIICTGSEAFNYWSQGRIPARGTNSPANFQGANTCSDQALYLKKQFSRQSTEYSERAGYHDDTGRVKVCRQDMNDASVYEIEFFVLCFASSIEILGFEDAKS
ncbi:hypothetical protein ONS96_005527 [Cadophora gregata f. sp. sojae]|nr:hypothetical protein ONS96_005527 [Cadophora gregata f. sp. sojae]